MIRYVPLVVLIAAGSSCAWLPRAEAPAPSKPCTTITGEHYSSPGTCVIRNRQILRKLAEQARKDADR